MKKIFLTLMLVSIFILYSCDNGKMNNEENGENGKETYYTVTYHKNTNYNKVVLGQDIIGEITGEPPIDTTQYKSGDRILGQNKEDVLLTAVFEGLGQGTMELEGYLFIGWDRRMFDVDDIPSFHGMEIYTDDNPRWWSPLPPPRAGWVVYHHNVEFDPIWRKKSIN